MKFFLNDFLTFFDLLVYGFVFSQYKDFCSFLDARVNHFRLSKLSKIIVNASKRRLIIDHELFEMIHIE